MTNPTPNPEPATGLPSSREVIPQAGSSTSGGAAAASSAETAGQTQVHEADTPTEAIDTATATSPHAEAEGVTRSATIIF